jgi:hypothetical protein
MPAGVVRALASVCCLLLALPPGWCCVASGGECCRRPCSKLGGGARKPAVCPKCDSACCAEGGAEAVPPAPLPPNEPTPSGKPACCERLPTDAPKVERPVVDLGTAGLEVPLVRTPGTISGGVRADAPPRSAFPPLHLLHCVWRC